MKSRGSCHCKKLPRFLLFILGHKQYTALGLTTLINTGGQYNSMYITMARYSSVAASFLFSALLSNLAYAQGTDYELQEIKPGVYVVSAGGPTLCSW